MTFIAKRRGSDMKDMVNFDPEIHLMPFPIGISRPVFPHDLYLELVDTFPTPDLFRRTNRSKDIRYILNDVKQRGRFEDWITRHAAWRELTRWVRSHEFAFGVLETLAQKGIDLAVRRDEHRLMPQLRRALGDMVKRGRIPRFPRFVHSRFEFAMLPGNGGYLKPHTDAPNTLAVLVVPMIRPGVWDPGWGGELEICRPKNPDHNFNWANRFMEFEDVEPIRKFPYIPNQCMFFIKTYDSWHCVRPMTAPDAANAMRRTITIVIERD